ncbi:MAG TPA: DUF3999 family protein [Thermoanaerobaculia bacterium]|nr:DUF3999 family protein [Thermoanaerobaculia bacterium]
MKTKGMLLLLILATLIAPKAEGVEVHERAIVPSRPGANRLPVDVTLMIAAAPIRYREEASPETLAGGLEDLRIYTGEGKEVPYLLVMSEPPQPRWRPGHLLRVQPTRTTSGLEVDLRASALIDRIRVEGLPAPFLKRLRLEAGGDRERWVLLVDEGTIFDLPDERLKQTEIRFPAGEYRHLRITWDDSSSARVGLPSGVSARLVSAATPPRERLALELTPRDSEPGRSRYRLKLPGPNLPIAALELEVENRYVLRSAAIQEAILHSGEIRPRVIGTGELKRAEREGLVASDLRIQIQRPSGSELDLIVENGDNPPLDVRAVWAELAPLPSVYFEVSTVEPLIARYGDRERPRPRYDLEALQPHLDVATLPRAHWGEPRVSGEAPDRSPLSIIGSPIDTSRFEYRRNIPAEEVGLNSLLLDEAVLAHSTLGDIRIVDEEGRQIPYLLEKRDEPLIVDLSLGRRESGSERRSLYRIRLPHETIPGPARLLLRTPARLFTRRVTLAVPQDDGRDGQKVISAAQWTHAEPESDAAALVVEIPLDRLRELVLGIDEGDNPPLDLLPPRLLLPSYRLRFFYPAGSQLTLHYGDPQLAAPRYDLALLSSRLFSLPAHEIRPASERAALLPAKPSASRFFYAALCAVVLVLLVILGRMLRLHDERERAASEE